MYAELGHQTDTHLGLIRMCLMLICPLCARQMQPTRYDQVLLHRPFSQDNIDQVKLAMAASLSACGIYVDARLMPLAGISYIVIQATESNQTMVRQACVRAMALFWQNIWTSLDIYICAAMQPANLMPLCRSLRH